MWTSSEQSASTAYFRRAFLHAVSDQAWGQHCAHWVCLSLRQLCWTFANFVCGGGGGGGGGEGQQALQCCGCPQQHCLHSAASLLCSCVLLRRRQSHWRQDSLQELCTLQLSMVFAVTGTAVSDGGAQAGSDSSSHHQPLRGGPVERDVCL